MLILKFIKLALAKRYAHCCFVQTDACRWGGVQKSRIGIPTHYGAHYFLCSPPRAGMRKIACDATSCVGIVIFVA